jgi:hypothetical protein
MSNVEPDWDDGTPNWSYQDVVKVPENRHCQRVPTAMFKQGSIWVDSSKQVWPIEKLADGHLDNLIRWIKQHADHWDGVPVLVSPLMRALEREQKKRIKTRNMTPRQALKDVMLNDSVIASPGRPSVDSIVARIIGGLKDRGYEVKRIG